MNRPNRWMFETRSHSWREVGLARQLSVRAANRARTEVVLLVPLFAGIVLLYDNRRSLLGVAPASPWDVPLGAVTVVVLVILGWAIARDIGRAAGPALFRRLDPGTAGTVGFLIRLMTIGGALIVALQVAGLDPRTLALGGDSRLSRRSAT
jgi:small conductance mechanosensitive channel